MFSKQTKEFLHSTGHLVKLVFWGIIAPICLLGIGIYCLDEKCVGGKATGYILTIGTPIIIIPATCCVLFYLIGWGKEAYDWYNENIEMVDGDDLNL